MRAARIVRIKSPADDSALDAERLARAAAAGSRRIHWEHDDGRVRLPMAEAVRAFAARTGLDPYSEECTALVMVLTLAFASEARRRREGQASVELRRRGRPAQDPALRRVLASAVDTIGSASEAALFLLIHGFDQWTVFPTSAHRLDVRRIYFGLVKDLSRIAKVTPRTETVVIAPGGPIDVTITT